MSRRMHGGFQPLVVEALCCIALTFGVGAATSHAADGPGARPGLLPQPNSEELRYSAAPS